MAVTLRAAVYGADTELHKSASTDALLVEPFGQLAKFWQVPL